MAQLAGKIAADSGASSNRKESFRLRISGKTYAQIGEVLGISRQAVCEHVNNELKAIRAETKQLAEHYRDIELSRLEMIFDVITAAIDTGDLTVLPHAHKNIELRCKLLGVNAPQEITLHGDQPEAILNRMNKKDDSATD